VAPVASVHLLDQEVSEEEVSAASEEEEVGSEAASTTEEVVEVFVVDLVAATEVDSAVEAESDTSLTALAQVALLMAHRQARVVHAMVGMVVATVIAAAAVDSTTDETDQAAATVNQWHIATEIVKAQVTKVDATTFENDHTKAVTGTTHAPSEGIEAPSQLVPGLSKGYHSIFHILHNPFQQPCMHG
jgi:hypothetical protein